MNTKMKAIAALVLAAGFTTVQGYAADATPPARKHTKHAPAKQAPATVTVDQLQELKRDMETQINSLKNELSDRDAKLKQAQEAASAAQAAAARAEAAAGSQQQAVTDNAAAVSTLQSTVTDLKSNAAMVATQIQDDQVKVKKAIENPDELHYKGVTLSPNGSFIEAATVYRSAATGGGINTPFTGIPLQYADAHNLSEFFAEGRQSRLALKAVGKLENVTFTGYYEMDWLGTGVTSNNNQSNSYVLRQRQLWAQAAFKNNWTVTAGQMWSLATETTKGLNNGTEILPGTIDPQYTAGFSWARQYGFRVSKQLPNGLTVGISAENPEILNPAGNNLPTNLLVGSAGVGGGLYNLNANYSFNLAPDMIAKAAWDPKFGGHYEVFGIGRFFQARVYSKDGKSAYNDKEVGGAIGGGFRTPLFQKKVSVGLKGLWGQGTGRYGNSTIADVTLRPNGELSPLHNFSALSTLEVNPNARLTLYGNYGGDYIFRHYYGSGSTAIGYGAPGVAMTGCNVEVAPTGSFTPSTPANCKGNNKDVQEATFGYWYNFYNGPKGRFRQGLQYSYFRRDLWSGAGGTTNPGGGAHGDDNVVETSLRYYLP